MDFCPKCEIRLKKNNSGSALVCPKCDYVKENIVKDDQVKLDESNSDFTVMGKDDMNIVKGLESTIKIDCEKCHNQEGVWWTFQTRSADEPETKFYRCIKCNHTWRDYT